MTLNDRNQISLKESLSYRAHGCELHRSPLSSIQLAQLRDEIDALATSPQPGIRSVLENSQVIRTAASSAFGLPGFRFERILRCIVFDKSPEANWKVGWHQDLNIKEQDGTCLPWSDHSKVRTLRLHLDPTPAANGALRVIPGSHRKGPLSDAQRRALQQKPLTLEANPGDILLMTPLLVHASSSSERPKRRRVVHVDYL
jgi:phytanoyl-CoA dioxygenase PhyH